MEVLAALAAAPRCRWIGADVVEFIEQEMMPIIVRHAISGRADINSEDALFHDPDALAMLIDIFSERGFHATVDLHRVEIPDLLYGRLIVVKLVVLEGEDRRDRRRDTLGAHLSDLWFLPVRGACAGVEQVALVGGRPFRLELARELGAAPVMDFRDLEAVQRLNQTGCPNIVEASGSEQAMHTAFTLAPQGGHVLVMGDYSAAAAHFAWNDLLHREIELIGSNASAGGWAQAVHLAVEGDLPLERIATHRFPVQRYREAFSLARDGTAPALRILLDWEI